MDNNYKGTTMSILEYGAMMRKLRTALGVHMDPWTEGRAYTISDKKDPKYFYQTSGVD